MANNLSCNIQHYNTDLPGRALLSEKQRPDLAHQESENSIPRSIDCVHSSRVLCISLRCARLGTDRLRTRSRYAGLASQENLKLHWRVLLPIGFSVPAVFFFMFTSAIIPFAIVTMIVGVLLVLGYERLLSRLSLKGWTDFQRLGLAAGAVFFFALF